MSDTGLIALQTAIQRDNKAIAVHARKVALSKPRTCTDCGTQYTATSPGQLRCPDCRVTASVYQGAVLNCKQCGQPFTRSMKRRVFCSDSCRRSYKPARIQQVAVTSSRWTTYDKGTFTDDEFRAELTKIANNLLDTSPMPEVMRGTVRLGQQTDESGTCPVCGGAYAFPLRRPGIEVCSIGCYEDYQRRKEIGRG